MVRFSLCFLIIAVAMPGLAKEPRPFCPDRPGLGTPPCTIDPGKVTVEIGLANWISERDPQTRTDKVLAGDMLVRAGIADHAEVQIGWTAYGHVRARDRTSGTVRRIARSGDMTLAVRRNLKSPDGSGASVAMMPFVSVPVGRMPVGDGDWGGGLIVPVSFNLGHSLSFAASPEVDAAVDSDGDGRHLAYGSVIGLELDLTDALSATLETSVIRDEERNHHATEALAGLSLGWQLKSDFQIDAGANLGLNRSSPDLALYAGIARRF